MTEIKLTKTPIKAIRIFLFSIPFVAIGIWQISSNDLFTFDWIMGLICTGFFSLGLFVGIFHFLDKRPQIVINENGIWDRTTKQDLIKWDQIIEAYPVIIYKQRFVSLVVNESFTLKTKQFKWAMKLNKKFGAQPLNIQISQIKIDHIEFVDFINSMINSEKSNRSKIIQEYFK